MEKAVQITQMVLGPVIAGSSLMAILLAWSSDNYPLFAYSTIIFVILRQTLRLVGNVQNNRKDPLTVIWNDDNFHLIAISIVIAFSTLLPVAYFVAVFIVFTMVSLNLFHEKVFRLPDAVIRSVVPHRIRACIELFIPLQLFFVGLFTVNGRAFMSSFGYILLGTMFNFVRDPNTKWAFSKIRAFVINAANKTSKGVQDIVLKVIEVVSKIGDFAKNMYSK